MKCAKKGDFKVILPKEKQCVSREIAMRMKNLEFRQDTEWYWNRQDDENVEWALSVLVHKDIKKEWLDNFGHKDKWMGIQPEHFCAAYTISELLAILPYNVSLHKQSIYHCYYVQEPTVRNISPEDSLGLMACHLKKQGLL